MKPIRPDQRRAGDIDAGDIDAADIDAEDIDFVVTDYGDGRWLPPETGDRQPDGSGRRPVGTWWCLAAVTVAVVGVLAAGQLYADRTRTIVSTRVVSSPGQATANLTGCPVVASCSWSEQPDGGPLFNAVRQLLPAAALVGAESVFDTGSAREYLARLVVRTPDGLLLRLTATRDPTEHPVPGWQSALPARGPADIALVVPGRRPGTALAITATVPAGVAVPVAALSQLAADPSLQLAP